MDTTLQQYIKTFPQYRETLELLQTLLNFQRELAQKIKPGQEKFSQNEAIEHWHSQKPLFSGERYAVDPSLFQESLTTLHPLLSSDRALQDALERLLASNEMPPLLIETLFDDFHIPDETHIQQWANDLAVSPDILAFLLQIVLSPFFEKAAEPYKEWIAKASWRRGICPICGSEPVMARLTRPEGRRVLTCSLCYTEWVFDRMRCPFCGNESVSEFNYFTVDDDKTHRVDCCDHCQRYLKTVDERLLTYPLNMRVENVITARLDTIANEQGYQ